MKKIVIGVAIASASIAATAAGVTVGAVYDYNAEKAGVRAQVSVPFVPVDGSVTYVEGLYTRYSVGKTVSLVSVGPVQLQATVAGVYQDTLSGGTNGYGLTAGVGAVVPLTKQVSAYASVERFAGQDKISQSAGTMSSVGLKVQF